MGQRCHREFRSAARAIHGRNKCPFFGEQSGCFSPAEPNLLFCHSDRSAAEWRNLAGNWAGFSVRDQIPPLRDAAPHSGRNDKMRVCFFRRIIAVFLRRSGVPMNRDDDGWQPLSECSERSGWFLLAHPLYSLRSFSGCHPTHLPINRKSRKIVYFLRSDS